MLAPHMSCSWVKSLVSITFVFSVPPFVAKKWSTKQSSIGKQTECGIPGTFIGLDTNQKGYVLYAPGTRQIYISGNIIVDETFGTAIAMS